MNARNAGSRQKLGETSFCCGRAEGHAIEQDLCAGSAEKEAAVPALFKSLVKFLPGCFKLSSGPHVTEFVQPRELQQDVQTADELPRSCSGIAAHKVPSRQPFLSVLITVRRVAASYNICGEYLSLFHQ